VLRAGDDARRPVVYGKNTVFLSIVKAKGHLHTRTGAMISKYARAGAMMLGVFILAGCVGGKVTPLISIPGVSSNGVVLHEPADGGPVILTGNVDGSFEKTLVERYVRNELGHKKVSNRINFRVRRR